MIKGLGIRYPDMSEPYKLELINKAKSIAENASANLCRWVANIIENI